METEEISIRVIEFVLIEKVSSLNIVLIFLGMSLNKVGFSTFAFPKREVEVGIKLLFLFYCIMKRVSNLQVLDLESILQIFA